MKIIYGAVKIGKFRNAVVAMGVFDGVHRGHRKILESAVKKARSLKGTSIALTFWPHPQKEESLYSLEHRLKLISGLGIDAAIVVNFSRNFSRISAEDFIKKILVEKIGSRHIYVGDNFRFGKDAQASPETLKNFSSLYGFKLEVFKVIKTRRKAISSTFIRSLIRRGDLAQAQNLLSRPVGILGSVIRGNLFARKLGFPTANINPHHEVIPPHGIYAVKVVFENKTYRGICYIGRQPTFLGPNIKTYIEVHIFNFNKRIYGKYLEVYFIKKIREERRFRNIRALAAQIRKDVRNAKRIFSRHK